MFQGKELTDLAAIQPGQTVLFNLTWATLYGPGRITDIWLDDESRNRALVGRWKSTATSFANEACPVGSLRSMTNRARHDHVFRRHRSESVRRTHFERRERSAPKDGSPAPVEPLGRLAVARDTLMTFDPVNDSKRGSLLAVKKIPVEPGSSGVQVTIKVT